MVEKCKKSKVSRKFYNERPGDRPDIQGTNLNLRAYQNDVGVGQLKYFKQCRCRTVDVVTIMY